MIKAVLFDLDGTLLDIDLASFLSEYFKALGPVVASVSGTDAETALDAVLQSTTLMQYPHPGESNEDVFAASFASLTGCDLKAPEVAEAIAGFYAREFPRLQGTSGPREGGLSAVAAARDVGLAVAVATNPIFPRAAILERMRWAGLDPSWFATITSYENSQACKPLPDYYRRIASDMGVAPSECVMVGDDPVLDLSAADVGMQTFFVGRERPVTSTWTGTLEDLASLVSRLVD